MSTKYTQIVLSETEVNDLYKSLSYRKNCDPLLIDDKNLSCRISELMGKVKFHIDEDLI